MCITNKENKTNEQKCDTLNNLNQYIVENEKFEQLLQKCKLVTTI